jgi:hypothetical protein
MYKNEHFTKTGSGQTWGKLKKEAVLSQHNVSRSMSGQWSVMPKILQVRQFLYNCLK